MLPKDGETALQITEREVNLPLSDCLVVDDLSAYLLPEKARAIFYQDCDLEDILYAEQHLTPQALLPLITPVTLTERFFHLPRIYLTCRYDLIISPTLQCRMYSETPCERVMWFMTGHASFLSAPDRLAARLLRIAHIVQKRQGNHE